MLESSSVRLEDHPQFITIKQEEGICLNSRAKRACGIAFELLERELMGSRNDEEPFCQKPDDGCCIGATSLTLCG